MGESTDIAPTAAVLDLARSLDNTGERAGQYTQATATAAVAI